MEFVIVRDVSSPGSWGDADKKSEIDLDDDFSVCIMSVHTCPCCFLIAANLFWLKKITYQLDHMALMRV